RHPGPLLLHPERHPALAGPVHPAGLYRARPGGRDPGGAGDDARELGPPRLDRQVAGREGREPGTTVPQGVADLSLLSAMITPAVLISACGTLIFSTSTRLARPVGVAGTLVLFHGCVMLMGGTRLSLRSVDLEMEFALKLRELYQARLPKA